MINVSFLLFTRNRSSLIILVVAAILYIIFILLNKEKLSKLKTITQILAVLLTSFFISLFPVKGTERPDLESTASTFFDSEFKSNVLQIEFLERFNSNDQRGTFSWQWVI